MKQASSEAEAYISNLAEEKRRPIEKLRKILLENLPNGFEETISNGMISYVIPHSIYSKGYHVDPKQPLPFISIAVQKSHIALYHMGLYADEGLLKWFKMDYPKYVKTKLDMGKSCVRFKNPDKIPFDLIGELAKKMTPEQWIDRYESFLK